MTDSKSSIRLNKYLALHLGISRRDADSLIDSGHVTIDGAPAELGNAVAATSVIAVDGKPVSSETDYQYIALHKPAGYVCSRNPQGDTPTVYELLPEKLRTLKLVGRLDKDSSGIILLTNDGDFAHSMTHPSFHKQKIYKVSLDHDLQPLHRQMISDIGVTLEDGVSHFEVERLTDGDDKNWRVIMSEGRNRQIRRTFASLGYTVTELHRTHFGPYAIDDIESGEYIVLPDL